MTPSRCKGSASTLQNPHSRIHAWELQDLCPGAAAVPYSASRRESVRWGVIGSAQSGRSAEVWSGWRSVDAPLGGSGRGQQWVIFVPAQAGLWVLPAVWRHW